MLYDDHKYKKENTKDVLDASKGSWSRCKGFENLITRLQDKIII
jgi:hypothetical protein